jgi:hypothetical protein
MLSPSLLYFRLLLKPSHYLLPRNLLLTHLRGHHSLASRPLPQIPSMLVHFYLRHNRSQLLQCNRYNQAQPNYNILLSTTSSPTHNVPQHVPSLSFTSPNYAISQFPSVSQLPPPSTLTASPMAGSILTPSKPMKEQSTPKKLTKDDWGDFDPLK